MDFVIVNYRHVKDFVLFSGWDNGFRFSKDLKTISLDDLLKRDFFEKIFKGSSQIESQTSSVDLLLTPFFNQNVSSMSTRSTLSSHPRLAFRADNLRTCSLEECFEELNLESKTPIKSFEKIIWELEDFESKENYKAKFHKVLDEIRDGRYYQINLLRFFEAKCVNGKSEINSVVESLVRRFFDLKPAMGFILKVEDLLIASFSPEKFLNFKKSQSTGKIQIESFPIKGTKARTQSDHWDLTTKDRAELNIIIDLMRNDLNQMARPGSVLVESDGDYLKTESVQHRVAKLVAELDTENIQGMGQILDKVLPSASISGAPKIEVLKAISEHEKFERGYFMGNLWMFDCSNQRIDSNILIRTLHGDLSKERFLYAAGSGITISSNWEDEYNEIDLKCKVLTV